MVALYAYLTECLQEESELELFGCWTGDEQLPLEHQREIRVDEITKPAFFFEEREFTKVRK